MKVLLISLGKRVDPIGVKSLHYYLLANNLESLLLCLPRNLPGDTHGMGQVRSFVAEHSPDLIGLSLMSPMFHEARDLTLHLKEAFPDIPVVWGGIHPSIAPEKSLEFADYVCVGEGEKTLKALAEAIGSDSPLTGVPNLVYRENGQIMRNPSGALIQLDDLPTTDHIAQHGFVLHRGRIVPICRATLKMHSAFGGVSYDIMTSRGCPFACTYCCNDFLSRLHGSRKVRRRSTDHILAELERAVHDNPEIRQITFQDECFLACGKEYLETFCESYRARVAMPFLVRAIPSFLTRKRMEALKSAGLAWINLGLQSGSDRVCKEVYKRPSLKKDSLAAARLIHEFRVPAYYDVILDNPFETPEEALATAEILIEMPRPFYVQFFSLTFYEGSEIYQRVRRETPELLEEGAGTDKDFRDYRTSVINEMTRMSPYLYPAYMKWILSLYKRNPGALVYKANLFVARLFSALVMEPLTYFRLLRLSKGGRYLETFRLLAKFLKEGVFWEEYVKQFRDKITRSRNKP